MHVRWKITLAALAVGAPLLAYGQSAPAFFTGQVPTAANWQSYFALKADVTNGTLASPTLSGTPTAPTAVASTATTQIATTAFVDTGFPKKANNLSDLASATTARTNLGLGTIATQAASAVAITGGTLTGVVTTATGYRDSGIITMSGGLVNTNSRLFLTPSVAGSNNASQAAVNYIGIVDQVNYYGANMMAGLFSNMSLGGGAFAGNRAALFGQLFLNTTANPGDASFRDYTAVSGRATAQVPNGGFQMSTDIDGTGPRSGLFGGVFQAQLITGATNFVGTTGLELNVSVATGTSVRDKVGLNLVLVAPDALRGSHSDSGLLFARSVGVTGSPGWKNVITIGRETSDTPTATDSTLFAVTPRLYGGTNTVPFLYGIDLRRGTITAGGAAFASPQYAVTATGETYSAGVTTSGTLRAQIATLTAITINDGGEYLLASATKPTFTVQAPPSGGTTATITTATMGAASVRKMGSTGKNYLVGDQLSVPGGTGTAPVLRVASIDAAGGVTSWTVFSNGAFTIAPANPVYPTGGTGTGAAVNIVYSASADTSVPSIIWPAATGSLYTAGTVLTVTGDTGTAGAFTAATVDAFGGITSFTVNAVGSVTAIGGTAGPDGVNYHAATSAVGSGASLGVAYKVLTTNITNAGAGYLPLPLPVIAPNLASNYRVADLLPTMTAAAATLALNPAGGAVQAGGVNVGRFVAVPASSTAACATGDFSADSSYIYACRATNLWTRAANVGSW